MRWMNGLGGCWSGGAGGLVGGALEDCEGVYV